MWEKALNKELATSYRVLSAVYFDGAYLSIELNKVNVDRARVNFGLITKICYGVIERDITLEYMISHHVKRMPDGPAMVILKIGTYAGKFLRSIPHYALVDELVSLANRVCHGQAGFINATLKNILRSKTEIPNGPDEAYNLSIRYSVPYNWVKQYISLFGLDFARQLVSAKLSTLTHIRVIGDTKKFYSECDRLKIRYEISAFPDTCYIDYEHLLNTPALKDNYVVQGLPSIIACRNFDGKYARGLDVCAAPGGKTMILAGICDLVVACDIYPHRLELVRKYANRLNINNVSCMVADATVYDPTLGEFDIVLADVPCSGLGVVGKKPDIYLSRKEENIEELVSVQSKIIRSAAKYVASGGTLIYSTCSILPCENEEIVRAFLKDNPDFRLVPVNTFGVTTKTNDGMETFYPHISGTEGFFIAKMERK